MTRRRLSVALVVVVVLVSGVAGCGDGGFSSPTAPTQSALNVSGTWVDYVKSVTFSLAQRGMSH